MDDGAPPQAGVSAHPRSRPPAKGLAEVRVALPRGRGLMVLAATAAASPLALREGWAIQSSAKVQEKGDVLSRPGFAPRAGTP